VVFISCCAISMSGVLSSRYFQNDSDVKLILMDTNWKVDGELNCSAILKSNGATKISWQSLLP
jgi:hypothetical protein